MHPWPPIGENLARLRWLAGLTQEELAERATVSVDLVRRLEQGSRSTARIGSLYRLAGALDVDLGTLLSQPGVLQPGRGTGKAAVSEPGSSPDTADSAQEPGAVRALRRVLMPAGIDDAHVDEADASAMAAGQWSTPEAWRLYRQGHFAELAVMLPGLIVAARQVAAGSDEAGSRNALLALAALYNLAAAVVVQLGWTDLGYVAAEQAVTAGEQAGDPSSTAVAVNAMSWVLLRQGRLAEAERIAVSTAERVEPRFSTATPVELSVWGSVLWGGLTATRHLLDVAQARQRLGDAPEALAVLLEVRRRAPEWIRYQVLARELVRGLLGARGAGGSRLPGLRDLAADLAVGT